MTLINCYSPAPVETTLHHSPIGRCYWHKLAGEKMVAEKTGLAYSHPPRGRGQGLDSGLSAFNSVCVLVSHAMKEVIGGDTSHRASQTEGAKGMLRSR